MRMRDGLPVLLRACDLTEHALVELQAALQVGADECHVVDAVEGQGLASWEWQQRQGSRQRVTPGTALPGWAAAGVSGSRIRASCAGIRAHLRPHLQRQ